MKRFIDYLYYAISFAIILTLIVIYSAQQLRAKEIDVDYEKEIKGHIVEEESPSLKDDYKLDKCG